MGRNGPTKKDFSASKNIIIIAAFIDVEINLDISNFICDNLAILLYGSKICEALSQNYFGRSRNLQSKKCKKVKKIKCCCLRK